MEPLTIDRRRLLQAGGLCGASWLTPLAGLLQRRAEAQERPGRPTSVIMLWMAGGPSQLETFDPQPGSPIAHGTGAIDTPLPGVQLAAGMEQTADQLPHMSLIRSLVTKEGDHQRGTYLVKTGYLPNPSVEYPSLGAVVCHQLPRLNTEIPRHISILTSRWHGVGGYLGAEHDAFKSGDPKHPVPDVTARVVDGRMRRRLEDLDVIERAFARGREKLAARTQHREMISAARKMMTSEQLAAFDIRQEPKEVVARFGDTPFGRGCLAARRLIEVGVRCVEVSLSNWDSHVNNMEIHRELVATLDPALAALVADLRERDLLDSTIVLCGGEFGRTPNMNALGGRDHWPHGFSFAITGGGIRRGVVVGQTDPQGSKKVVDPHHIHDLHATVYQALGIDFAQEFMTPANRPVKLCEGKPIEALLAGA